MSTSLVCWRSGSSQCACLWSTTTWPVAGQQYMFALHWSLTNFCGNTGMYPRTLQELIYATFAVYSAMLCFSFFVSSVTNAMVQLQKYTSQATERCFLLHRYLRDQKVSKKLQVRVRKFLREESSQPRNDTSLCEILATLPSTLIAEINSDVLHPVLKRNDLLRICCEGYLQMLPKLCLECISQRVYMDEENVFAAGEECFRASFLQSGSLYYDAEWLAEVLDVAEQRWYCEVALYIQWLHVGAMYGHFQCTMIHVDVETFERIVAQNKKLQREITLKANELRRWLINEVKPSRATDLLAFVKDRGDVVVDQAASVSKSLTLIKIQRDAGARISIADNL
eukprot:4907393-Amphidinium_carterae.1